jgi:hypothetical protein
LFHFVLYLLLELERQQVNKDKVYNVSNKYKVFIGNTFRIALIEQDLNINFKTLVNRNGSTTLYSKCLEEMK